MCNVYGMPIKDAYSTRLPFLCHFVTWIEMLFAFYRPETPQSIRHCNKSWPHRTWAIMIFGLLPIILSVPWDCAASMTCQLGILTSPDAWSFQIWNLYYVLLLCLVSRELLVFLALTCNTSILFCYRLWLLIKCVLRSTHILPQLLVIIHFTDNHICKVYFINYG